jgi:hypothetical protein
LAAITRSDASSLLGGVVTFQSSTASDTLVGGQSVHLLVNNTSGSTQTVTITTPEQVEGALAVTDRVVSVLTANIKEIPIPSRYNDPATGLTTVVCTSPGATVTVANVLGSPQT